MTTIMASSKLKPNQIQCAIRGEWVTITPEERIRQQLLLLMIKDLGYPKGWLCVEQPLANLPHLLSKRGKVPRRRADIICYAPGISQSDSLYPLLLVECKAVALTAKTQRQLIGYNHYVGAPFICLANEEGIYTGWLNETHQYQFVPGLPPYRDLYTGQE